MNAVFSFLSSRPVFFRAASILVAVTVLATLPACNDEQTRNGINERAAEAQKTVADMDRQSPVKHYNPLVVTDKVWAGSEALRMQRGMPLPSKYEGSHGVTLIASEPMSLADIASAVTEQTGIPVRINEIGGKGSVGAATMPISYEGPFSGLMERVTGYFGVGWHYDGATVTIARFETRVFQIEALPGTQGVTESTSGGSTTASSSTSSVGTTTGSSTAPTPPTSDLTQTIKFSVDFKYWEELGQILTSMLGGTGTIVVSPSVGTVTVSTTPEIMRSVAQYLAQENQRLSRQIAINIRVYSVTLQEGMDFDIAFSTILNKLTDFGVTLGGASGLKTGLVSNLTGPGTLSVAILNPNIGKPFGQFTDAFSAISGVGDTSTLASFPLVTLNNRPVSRRIGTNQVYLASTTAGTLVAGSGTTGGGLQTGTLQLGFTVQVTPRLLDDGRILLEYSLSDQGLVGTIQQIDVPNVGSVQTPNTTIREFVQQSVLKSGSMLILGGAEQEDLAETSQGVANPFNYLLGGGFSSNRTHTMVIMTIAPQVLDVPHTEQD